MPTVQQRLSDAKEALHALILGESVVSVTVLGGRTNQYKAADESKLRRYIQELEAEIGINGSGYRGPIEFFG